ERKSKETAVSGIVLLPITEVAPGVPCRRQGEYVTWLPIASPPCCRRTCSSVLSLWLLPRVRKVYANLWTAKNNNRQDPRHGCSTSVSTVTSASWNGSSKQINRLFTPLAHGGLLMLHTVEQRSLDCCKGREKSRASPQIRENDSRTTIFTSELSSQISLVTIQDSNLALPASRQTVFGSSEPGSMKGAPKDYVPSQSFILPIILVNKVFYYGIGRVQGELQTCKFRALIGNRPLGIPTGFFFSLNVFIELYICTLFLLKTRLSLQRPHRGNNSRPSSNLGSCSSMLRTKRSCWLYALSANVPMVYGHLWSRFSSSFSSTTNVTFLKFHEVQESVVSSIRFSNKIKLKLKMKLKPKCKVEMKLKIKLKFGLKLKLKPKRKLNTKLRIKLRLKMKLRLKLTSIPNMASGSGSTVCDPVLIFPPRNVWAFECLPNRKTPQSRGRRKPRPWAHRTRGKPIGSRWGMGFSPGDPSEPFGGLHDPRRAQRARVMRCIELNPTPASGLLSTRHWLRGNHPAAAMAGWLPEKLRVCLNGDYSCFFRQHLYPAFDMALTLSPSLCGDSDPTSCGRNLPRPVRPSLELFRDDIHLTEKIFIIQPKLLIISITVRSIRVATETEGPGIIVDGGLKIT
ncbi:unnamed protein product, partial [Nesidiocoris tenuis]